jgi:mRNA-degrading endonuclease toxin of MazEF toxin-antitoxin module
MPKRGDLYYAEVAGSEARGREQFERRPWVIVSSNRLNNSLETVIAVPLTTQLRKHSEQTRVFRVLVPKNEIAPEPSFSPQDSLALTEQVRVLDSSRLDPNRAGTVSLRTMAEISAALLFAMDLA